MWRSKTRNVLFSVKKNSRQQLRRCTQSAGQESVPSGKKKGFSLGKFVGLTSLTAVVGGAGVAGYAYMDPDFRKTVEGNVPYSKEALDWIYSQIGLTTATDQPVKLEVDQKKSKPEPLIPVEKPKQEKPKTTQPTVEPAKQTVEEKKTEVKKEVPETPAPPAPVLSAKEKKEEERRKKKEEEERKKAEAKRKLELKEQEEAAQNAALQNMLESLAETSKQKAAEAMEAQKELINKIKAHTEALKTAMEDKTQILDKDAQWSVANDAFEARQEMVKKAEELSQSARDELEKLKQLVADGRQNVVTKKNKALSKAQEAFNKITSELNKVTTEVAKTEADSKVMVKYRDLIDKGKKQFQRELEGIMPDLKLGKGKGKKLTEEELNSLIAHAHRRIEQLQKQLAEQITMEEQRLEKALTHQRDEDDKLGEQRVKHALDKAKNDFDLEKDNWEIDARVMFERELKLQLSRQAAAYSHHLQEMLAEQEKKLDKKMETEINIKILEERKNFKAEVESWIARLKGIETAVTNRAEAEKTARQAKELWLACNALNAAIENGQGYKGYDVEWEQQLKPLNDFMVAIEEAASQHPFVAMVVNTVPDEALYRGVWTEKNLKLRFDNVYRVCKRVARIDETGASLYQYFLSYLQSFLINPRVYVQASSDKVDIEEMDTYEILAHAKYFVGKGDLEQAVRFMNQLKGEARNVASDWIKETILTLEACQAAQSLSAFATASGIF